MTSHNRGVIIGVTGSLGTGKTTVAQWMARRGAQVIDADQLAHALVCPGKPVWRRLRRRFGDRILNADRTINKPALAGLGFASRRAWRDLCAMIHPAVIVATKIGIRRIRRRHPGTTIVLDVPLLVESGMTSLVDWVVVVATTRRTQLIRLRRKAQWPLAEIRRRLRWQMPLAVKVRRADVVIDNGGSRRATAAQLHRFWQRLH